MLKIIIIIINISDTTISKKMLEEPVNGAEGIDVGCNTECLVFWLASKIAFGAILK